jgi:hypothetical protein
VLASHCVFFLACVLWPLADQAGELLRGHVMLNCVKPFKADKLDIKASYCLNATALTPAHSFCPTNSRPEHPRLYIIPRRRFLARKSAAGASEFNRAMSHAWSIEATRNRSLRSSCPSTTSMARE